MNIPPAKSMRELAANGIGTEAEKFLRLCTELIKNSANQNYFACSIDLSVNKFSNNAVDIVKRKLEENGYTVKRYYGDQREPSNDFNISWNNA